MATIASIETFPNAEGVPFYAVQFQRGDGVTKLVKWMLGPDHAMRPQTYFESRSDLIQLLLTEGWIVTSDETTLIPPPRLPVIRRRRQPQ